jgi:intracellular sulfur oxidation DsrE/DsrF family protein
MKSTVIVFNSNGMGNAPEELSKTLVKNYLDLLVREKNLPLALLFYGEGVKLLCEESELTQLLMSIESKGVRLIACKTCLNYFGLFSSIKAGKIGTMADILTFQLEAAKVITV